MVAVACADGMPDEKSEVADAPLVRAENGQTRSKVAYSKESQQEHEETSLQEDIARMRKRLQGGRFLINPNTKWMQRWDLLTIL